MQLRGPAEKATNENGCLSCIFSLVNRSGRNLSGSGKISGLRPIIYGATDTLQLAGNTFPSENRKDNKIIRVNDQFIES